MARLSLVLFLSTAAFSALAVAQTLFSLSTQSLNAELNGKTIQACGNHLNIGGETCTWCYNAPPVYVCSTYQNQTVLIPGGQMAADVPGAQYWFVDPVDSVLKYTRGGRGNSGDVQYAGKNVTISGSGFFVHDAGRLWLACAVAGSSNLYHIYSPSSDSTGCVEIELATSPVSDRKQGAYLYE